MKKSFRIYQVDAFTNQLFKGNPAAVVPLENWLPDAVMQNIAMENNLSETAFFVKDGNDFSIRWFTPTTEVDLCGHATLASAHVIFNHLNYDHTTINFKSRSGQLIVSNRNGLIELDFPAAKTELVTEPVGITEALGKKPLKFYNAGDDLLAVYNTEAEVRQINPNFENLKTLSAYRGIIVTAPGIQADFVSRFFGPSVGVNEDPVTGSAHTALIPYWSERLSRQELTAHQVSARGGILYCKNSGNRVLIAGYAVIYLTGEIFVDF